MGRIQSAGTAVRLTLLTIWAGISLSGAALASPQATDVAGVPLPDHVSVAGHDLVLNGAGLRRILFLKVYVAALYLPAQHHEAREILDQDSPRALRLMLLRNLSTEQNLEALRDGLIANNSPEVLRAIEPEVEQFLGYIKSLKEVAKGTVIHLGYQPGQGTLVSVGERHLGTVPGSAFNRAVLRIWLGEDPVQTNLKRALLGEG